MTKASSMSKDGLIVARFSLAAENEGQGQSIRRCGDSDLDLNELHLGETFSRWPQSTCLHLDSVSLKWLRVGRGLGVGPAAARGRQGNRVWQAETHIPRHRTTFSRGPVCLLCGSHFLIHVHPTEWKYPLITRTINKEYINESWVTSAHE